MVSTTDSPDRRNILVYSLPLIPVIFTFLSFISLQSTNNPNHYMSFFHWLIIAINICILLVSLTGIAGAYNHNKRGFLHAFYFTVTPWIIVALIAAFVIPLAVIPKGSGRRTSNGVYRDYYLQDYSGWLKTQVVSDNNWGKIRSSIHHSKICAKTGRIIGEYPETEYMYYFRKLNPIESGCCKPPTECGYNYVNETVWNRPVNLTIWNPMNDTSLPTNLDFIMWNNHQEQLCYNCDSCKAGVLGRLRNRLSRIALIYNLPALIILTIAYAVAYAYNKSKRANPGNNNPRANDKTIVNKVTDLYEAIKEGILRFWRGY